MPTVERKSPSHKCFVEFLTLLRTAHFLQHLKESEPTRIEALLQRGYHDVNWITRKYKLEPHRMPHSRFNVNITNSSNNNTKASSR
jgi:hypothetical protein